MTSPITTADNREMRGLWRHLLKDAVGRGWYAFIPPAMLIFIHSRFVTLPEVAESMGSALVAVWIIYQPIGMFVHAQRLTKPLLVTLPLSRTTRGRFIWVQYIAISPAFYYAEIALLVAVTALFGRDTSHFGWFVSPLYLSCIAFALAGPAAAFVLFQRAPLGKLSLTLAGMPLVLIAVVMMLNGRSEQPLVLPLSSLLAVLTVSLVVIGISYMRAPRFLAITPPTKPWPAHRRRGREKQAAPPRPGIVGPLWSLVLLSPLKVVPIAVGVLVLICIRADPQDAYLPAAILLAFLVVLGFVMGGMLAVKHAKLMRMLPVSPGRLATTIIAYGVATSLCMAVAAIIFMRVALPDVSPATVMNPILLGVCLGSFVPVVVMRSSDFLGPAFLYEAAVLILILLNQIFYGMTSGNLLPLPLLSIAAPLCVIAATRLLRKAILHESAYGYREPPDQPRREGF